MLYKDEEKVRNLIYILEIFCLGIAHGEDDDVSKVLGAPFGLSFTTKNVDDFLYEKLIRKLIHWSATQVNPTCCGVVTSNRLLSLTFFFLSIWGGSKDRVARIKSMNPRME